jgi:glycosyltransferase involved in cell wall biosynthesis
MLRELRIAQCSGCRLVMLQPSPVRTDTGQPSFESSPGPPAVTAQPNSSTEREAAGRYLAMLQERGLTAGRILLVSAAEHPFEVLARAAGFEVTAVRSITDLGPLENDAGSFAAAVLLQQLGRASEPIELLQRVHAALRPQGLLLLTTPSLDSWTAKRLGVMWPEWGAENRYYFNHNTTHSALLKGGFEQVQIQFDRRRYTFDHVYHRAGGFPPSLLTTVIRAAFRLTPSFLHQVPVRLSTSSSVVVAARAELRPRPLLSILVPVYNERATFCTLMDALLKHTIPGVDREIVLVESNSSDGTREEVKRYASHPEVRLILEDRPRGKGYAVRTALANATGDFCVIQDADLEYDLNDYETLLEPLLERREAFVLGARHGGHWKMRQFRGQPLLTTLCNMAHVFFTGIINILYRQHMTDPLTMFKLFCRDCVYGLEFKCNRFDFDHELVIKLVRKGYTPVEIPVNYRSRSFKEGKKIRYRDAFVWLWTDLKLRFTPLYPKNPKRPAVKTGVQS